MPRQPSTGTVTARFRYVVLYVRDVPAAVEFYEHAFGLRRRHLDTHENGAYAELETGDTTLAFASHELVGRHLPAAFGPHDLAHPPSGTELTLEVLDLDATLARAQELGATLVGPPELKVWGQRYAFLRDPERVLLGVTDRPAA